MSASEVEYRDLNAPIAGLSRKLRIPDAKTLLLIGLFMHTILLTCQLTASSIMLVKTEAVVDAMPSPKNMQLLADGADVISEFNILKIPQMMIAEHPVNTFVDALTFDIAGLAQTLLDRVDTVDDMLSGMLDEEIAAMEEIKVVKSVLTKFTEWERVPRGPYYESNGFSVTADDDHANAGKTLEGFKEDMLDNHLDFEMLKTLTPACLTFSNQLRSHEWSGSYVDGDEVVQWDENEAFDEVAQFMRDVCQNFNSETDNAEDPTYSTGCAEDAYNYESGLCLACIEGYEHLSSHHCAKIQ